MKIAIAGYGLEGESNYRHFASYPENEITIVDENYPSRALPDGVATIIGDKAFEKLQDFDLVVRTAGLSPRKIKTNGKIWSATNEFFSKCPVPIIGVTGTKGKGTTSSLIASILQASGKKVWLVGNIGKAAIETLSSIDPEDIVIYEMSSFQLWDIEYSPHIAVVLPIEPDHLNVHIDFEDYVNAKSNIRRYQKDGDICVYHPTNPYSKKIAEATDQGRELRYAIRDDGCAYVDGDNFCMNGENICLLDSLRLIGGHNRENACAAITVAKLIGVSNETIEKGIKLFDGLPHRLELVRELDGVKYYNDSFSSAPGATIAAIKSFDQPEILILGGIDKGADFSGLAAEINTRNNIKKILVIGEIREKLANIIRSQNPNINIEITDLNKLQPIVLQARSYAESGDVVVLSPACASFDMFRDFYDRGDQFRSIVNSFE